MRSSIGSAALDALNEHFEALALTTNAQRRQEATRLMEDDTYIYGTVRASKTSGQVCII